MAQKEKTDRQVVVREKQKTHHPEDQYDFARSETRYVIADAETGRILDDAQGYGYKTKQKAWAAWGYKNRDKSKDPEKRKKRFGSG